MKISRLQVILIDILALLSFVFCYILSRLMHGRLPVCFIKEMLGFLCPACGGTRCVIAFTSIDFADSFKYNPYIFVTIIFMVIVLMFLNFTVFINSEACRNICRKVLNYRAIIFWAIGFAVFGIIRNFV